VTAVLTQQETSHAPAEIDPLRSAQPITVTGAASIAIRPLLLGQPRPLALLAVFPSAIYLTTGDGVVVALVGTASVRLPCAVVLGSDSPDLMQIAAQHASYGASAGRGVVAAGRLRVEAGRWWLPMPPAPPPDATVLARGLSALSSRLAVQQHRLLRVVADGLRRLEAAVRTRDTRIAEEATLGLLGLGQGLTPSGDDVLAGMLVGLHHLDWTRGTELQRQASRGQPPVSVIRDTIATRVLVDAPTRTATLSAALLGHAARGEAAGEVTAVLNSLCGRRPLSPALMRLLAVGHTSGYDTACGVLAAGRALLGQRDPSS
jgi:Protein of unknown function (DUF2877)